MNTHINLLNAITKHHRFLERGYCREASRCNFSHDNLESIKIPNDYCHFYLANQCLYGQDCKFRHSEPFHSNALSNSCESGENNPLVTSESMIELTGQQEQLSTRTEVHPTDQDWLTLEGASQRFSTSLPSISNGLDCDLCGRPCLDPYDLAQQRQHREDCLREHEREMEHSFAVQRSRDKVCGICMDTVVEKKPITSSRFGILEKCNHIFCLDCIRKWRGTKQFETRTIRCVIRSVQHIQSLAIRLTLPSLTYPSEQGLPRVSD